MFCHLIHIIQIKGISRNLVPNRYHFYQKIKQIHHLARGSKMPLIKAAFQNYIKKKFRSIRFFVTTSTRTNVNCIHSSCMDRNLKKFSNHFINKIQHRRSFSVVIENNADSVNTEFSEQTIIRQTFKHLLSYIDVSVHVGNITQAQNVLLCFTEVNNFGPDTISLFNIVLNGWASKGNWTQVSELLEKMEKLFIPPNLQSYCAAIECIVRSSSDKNSIKTILNTIENRPDLHLENLLEECSFVSDQKEKVLEGIRLVIPDFVPKKKIKNSVWNVYDLDLLKDLKSSNTKHDYRNSTKNVLPVEELQRFITLQLERECAIHLAIPSIIKPVTDDSLQWKTIWNSYMDKWKKSLLEAFKEKISEMGEPENQLSLYPYLIVLNPEIYVDVTLQEMQTFIQNSSSRMLKLLQQDIGLRIMKNYFIQKKKKCGIIDGIKTVHEQFIHYYTDTNITAKYTAREYWEFLQETLDIYPIHMEILWPKNVIQGIGLFMLEIVMQKVHINKDPFNTASELKIPVFSLSFRQKFPRIKYVAGIRRLFLAAHVDELMLLDSTFLPMIAPPLPWMSFHNGGFFTSTLPVLRFPRKLADNFQREIENTSPYNLYGLFDALNKLSSCAWKINEPLLDIAINVYANGGNSDIYIPSPYRVEIKSSVMMAKQDASMGSFQLKKKKHLDNKRRNEIHYALSIANAFRKNIIWQPHNADFRGIASPCIGYFKHSGPSIDDVISSLFLFANGEELGKKGIEWLKLHLINLIGTHGSSSSTQKLEYCDQILDDVMDSANNPLTGKKWWMKSRNPWQTLACCMELTKCLSSPDPSKYVCHLPVHQYSSANLLQHYAALTRDEQCAELLNLVTLDKPADIFTKLADMVEIERRKDESNIKIARMLKGYISRDVVKPVIITTSYNATNYGALLRVATYLKKNAKDFPMELQKEAAGYVTERASIAVRKLFSSTKQLQNWLKKISDILSTIYQEPIQWITPFGFPVILPPLDQTYSENMVTEMEEYPSLEFKFYVTADESFPEIAMTSFPPNFIVSLEASHMMLTALQCQRQGIEFVYSRNNFWTLPSTVDLMNQIAREQFVNLYSQPLLDRLLKEITEHCITPKNADGLNSLQSELLQVLNSPPKLGNFDINKVLKSTYFFY